MVQVKTPEKINVKVESNNDGDIFIDGKKYVFDKSTWKKIGKETHLDKNLFKEEEEGKREEYEKVVINKLKTKTTAEELLKEIFKSIPLRFLKKIAKRIKDKKPIEKHKGCLGFRIGEVYLELFD